MLDSLLSLLAALFRSLQLCESGFNLLQDPCRSLPTDGFIKNSQCTKNRQVARWLQPAAAGRRHYGACASATSQEMGRNVSCYRRGPGSR
ncbi:hypothetical protein C8J57DRAFT_1303022 [Mycena rebaudengoi]|nr:hypothetical protein C8J57DRAFT_1309660 [Mycena rebaudengoi]KAJ7279319.1 hypothetical protein C8J57DRAFT_1303022 [Mycena rebaudengoi]